VYGRLLEGGEGRGGVKVKQLKEMTDVEKWEELFCRIARIEDKLEIDEHEEPMPDRVKDAWREDLKNFGAAEPPTRSSGRQDY